MGDGILGLESFDTTAGAEEGAVMEVRSPATGEVLYWKDAEGKDIRPWTVTYYGADSDRVQRVSRAQTDRRIAAQRRGGVILAAVVEKDNIELLVTATKSWDIPLGDGTPAESEPKEYRAAYTRYKWLFEQGNEFSGLRANFLKTKPET